MTGETAVVLLYYTRTHRARTRKQTPLVTGKVVCDHDGFEKHRHAIQRRRVHHPCRMLQARPLPGVRGRDEAREAPPQKARAEGRGAPAVRARCTRARSARTACGSFARARAAVRRLSQRDRKACSSGSGWTLCGGWWRGAARDPRVQGWLVRHSRFGPLPPTVQKLGREHLFFVMPNENTHLSRSNGNIIRVDQ